MDQDASWVGLGWNINPGVLNRSVRGVPDDFKGDQVIRQFNMKPERALGVNGGIETEVFGLDFLKVSASVGLGFSVYNGYQFDVNVSPTLASSDKCKSRMEFGLGLSASSSKGIDVSPVASYGYKANLNQKKDNLSLSIGSSYNSREGLKAITFNANIRTCHNVDTKNSKNRLGLKLNGSTDICSFVTPTYIIKPESQITNYTLSFNASLGGELFGVNPNFTIGGYSSFQTVDNEERSYCASG